MSDYSHKDGIVDWWFWRSSILWSSERVWLQIVVCCSASKVFFFSFFFFLWLHSFFGHLVSLHIAFAVSLSLLCSFLSWGMSFFFCSVTDSQLFSFTGSGPTERAGRWVISLQSHLIYWVVCLFLQMIFKWLNAALRDFFHVHHQVFTYSHATLSNIYLQIVIW